MKKEQLKEFFVVDRIFNLNHGGRDEIINIICSSRHSDWIF